MDRTWYHGTTQQAAAQILAEGRLRAVPHKKFNGGLAAYATLAHPESNFSGLARAAEALHPNQGPGVVIAFETDQEPRPPSRPGSPDHAFSEDVRLKNPRVVYGELAKSEPLDKGAMRRIAPFNPEEAKARPAGERFNPITGKMQPVTYGEQMSRWVDAGPYIVREQLAHDPITPEERLRSLHKLHALTQVRRHPITGEREFLLHRGHSEEETAATLDDPAVYKNADSSSWTPHFAVAERFSGMRGRVSSAWIPESSIGRVPKQYGNLAGPRPGKPMQLAAREHEVLVKPGEYEVHAQPLPASVTITSKAPPTVDERINTRGLRAGLKKAEEGVKRVALIMAVRDGLLLMGKRSDNGRWTLPGGSLEEGESFPEGARRELREETGLEPVGELRLVDSRTLGETEIKTYRCAVKGTPTGKNDPDKECRLWVFVDVSKGMPKGVAENMAGPKNPDDNVAADVIGLEKVEPKSDASVENDDVELKKTMPGPRFPKMGFADDRRETPIVSTPLELENKAKLMAARQVSAMESEMAPRDRDPRRRRATAAALTRENMEPSGQVLTQGTSIGYSKDVGLRGAPRGDLNDYGLHNNAPVATREHENFHFMMNRVEQKHGSRARGVLARNLFHKIDPLARSALQTFVAVRMPSISTKHPLHHEEALAVLLNYLNNPGERHAFHTHMGHDQDFAREFGLSMKRAHRDLHSAANEADDTWATEAKPWNRVDYKDPAKGLQSTVPAALTQKTELDLFEQESSLGKMAIKDIAPGKETHYGTDYSHLLRPEQREAGYQLLVDPDKDSIRARLFQGYRKVGYAVGYHAMKNPAWLEPHSQLDKEHRGQGLGRSMYEALYAHAYRRGIRKIVGDAHSTDAHRVHEALARRHGLDYSAEVLDPQDFEGRGSYGPYQYVIKDELPAVSEPVSMEKAELDEVDRLLLHPNIVERRMALKLSGVRPKHLVRALSDSDPEIQELAFAHPAYNHEVTSALMQMPGRESHQIRAIPRADRNHLEALYHLHKRRPFHELAPILAAISQAPALDSQMIDALLANGHGHGAVENLRTSPEALKRLVEAHLLDPQDDDKRALARRAVKHPNLDPIHAERAYRDGPMDVKIAVAQGPHLPEHLVQETLQRGHLPTGDHEALLRSFVVQNKGTQPKHLQIATRDRNPQVSFQAKQRLGVFKAEVVDWLGERLAKAVHPDHFTDLMHSVGEGGRSVVNHEGEVAFHPAVDLHDVQAYRQHVLGPTPVERAPLSGIQQGVQQKVIYKLPPTHQTHPNARFMVKPYHEQQDRFVPHQHQGWAEMTHQALYHAGGLGHLHQKVHVTQHPVRDPRTGETRTEPMLVVKLGQGTPVSLAERKDYGPEAHHDARRMAAMDFLTDNYDRHGDNLLVEPLTAIDHSRAFQYGDPNNTGGSLRDFAMNGALEDVLPRDEEFSHAQWAPVFQWWEQASPAIRETMARRLEMIKDPHIRDHIRRNFEERARWLDDRARYGVDKFGPNWQHEMVRRYEPGEVSDQERAQLMAAV